MNKAIGRLQQEKHALFGMASEIGELHALYQKRYQGHAFDDEHAQKELGDLLFTVVNLCRKKHVKPQDALSFANRKFVKRFNYVNKIVTDSGLDYNSLTDAQWDDFWNIAKQNC